MRPLVLLAACAALIVACASTPANDPPQLAGLPQSSLTIVTANGTHRFDVWIAADDKSRGQGLMNVRELPPGRGMLFLFDPPRYASFWMKDTYLSLDLIFVGPDGVVVNIAQNAKPLSLDPIQSVAPVTSVLELLGGTAALIGLSAGDRVDLTSLLQ